MPITITPLLELDPEAERMDTDDLVDLVRLNVLATASSALQAVTVLVRLGRDPGEAARHVEYCLTGSHEPGVSAS